MSPTDETSGVPESSSATPGSGCGGECVAAQIRRLVAKHPFAVLCTQGEGQPYGSLIAYAMTDDLTSVVFATRKATRKFRLLTECDHVALVIDSRPEFPDDLMKVEGVTATGRAAMVEEGADFDRWARLLTDRHPQLKQFVHAASSGLFRIEIIRYFHVSHFQEVRQWIPSGDG
jgi:uncharacterized protein YhbP (UPF0306 family)